MAAAEARAVGIHQLCTLVIEPNRDPRMGRNEEGYSEDPYLVSRIAEVDCPRRSGRQRRGGQQDCGRVHRFPRSKRAGQRHRAWRASKCRNAACGSASFRRGLPASPKAGGLGVMAGYPVVWAFLRMPPSGLFTSLLREEMGFQGLVLSEGGGFSTIVYEGIVPTQKEAGALGLKAGVDVDISYEAAYMKPLIENVEEGRVSMALIDRALRRVLTQKFRLGLFERPYVDPQRAVKIMHTKEHQDLALRTAREGHRASEE